MNDNVLRTARGAAVGDAADDENPCDCQAHRREAGASLLATRSGAKVSVRRGRVADQGSCTERMFHAGHGTREQMFESTTMTAARVGSATGAPNACAVHV